MANRSAKKVLLLGVYLAAIILGLYMTFFNKSDSELDLKEDKEQSSTGQIGEDAVSIGHDYTYLEFPDTENEAADELYTEAGVEEVNVYFSNTDSLDNGSIPLEVQAVLAQATETYLNERGYEDVTELYIEENSYKESESRIVFVCYMDGYADALQIEYKQEENRLVFCILSS